MPSSSASAPPERRRPPRPASSARIARWPRPCSPCAADAWRIALYSGGSARRRLPHRAFASPAAVVYARERTQRPAHLRRGRGAGAGAADAGAGGRAAYLSRKRSAPAGRGAASVHRPRRHADAHPAGRGRLLSRIPAVWDSELPSPAALLLHALALADGLPPAGGLQRGRAHPLAAAAAPYARQQPLACAGLIDAANFTLSESREAQPHPQ